MAPVKPSNSSHPPPSSRATLLVAIERRDVTDTSFGFVLPEGDREADEWEKGDGGIYRRTVRRAVQRDVSFVARGAYAESELAVRDARASLDAFLTEDNRLQRHPNQRFLNRQRWLGW